MTAARTNYCTDERDSILTCVPGYYEMRDEFPHQRPSSSLLITTPLFCLLMSTHVTVANVGLIGIL